MQKVTVDLSERTYDIIIKEGLLSTNPPSFPGAFCKERSCLIVSDSNVYGLYGKTIEEALSESSPRLLKPAVFGAGEASKTLGTVSNIYHEAVSADIDRSSVVIGFGGGVTGDIAGFVAATYMRGIDFIQVPTTLLAMVDSSVGGKTGVDLPEGKNLVGAFWQPKLVLIDPSLLKTLPEREIRCGLAEIVKYGVILDEDFFNTLESNTDKINMRDSSFYEFMISKCCSIKAAVVKEDEREETGLRAVLNYGHTFGHGLEAASGFADLLHGEAVSVGMCMAADLAVQMGIFTRDSAQRQEKLLSSLNLPCSVKGCNPESVYNAMKKDKKKKSGKISFILPEKIGSTTKTSCTDENLILNVIAGRCA